MGQVGVPWIPERKRVYPFDIWKCQVKFEGVQCSIHVQFNYNSIQHVQLQLQEGVQCSIQSFISFTD